MAEPEHLGLLQSKALIELLLIVLRKQLQPLLIEGRCSKKMSNSFFSSKFWGAGHYPKEYNPKVHGPYYPFRYYGKRKFSSDIVFRIGLY